MGKTLTEKIIGEHCAREVRAEDFAVANARIFYRNAINIGLPVIECDTDKIEIRDEKDI